MNVSKFLRGSSLKCREMGVSAAGRAVAMNTSNDAVRRSCETVPIGPMRDAVQMVTASGRIRQKLDRSPKRRPTETSLFSGKGARGPRQGVGAYGPEEASSY